MLVLNGIASACGASGLLDCSGLVMALSHGYPHFLLCNNAEVLCIHFSRYSVFPSLCDMCTSAATIL